MYRDINLAAEMCSVQSWVWADASGRTQIWEVVDEMGVAE